MTEVQVLRNGSWESIDLAGRNAWRIDIPTSSVGLSPSAEIVTHAREDIDPNQDLRIIDNDDVLFEGATVSSGTIRQQGQRELSAVHPSDALFDESVTVELVSPTATEVLNAALVNSERGGSFTLEWSGSDVTLSSDYEAEDKTVPNVFRDIADRTGRLFWVDPADEIIHVEPVGGRGLWESLDAQSDGIALQSYDEGSVKTVVNDVTVNATAGENVTGRATDAESIDTYGKRSKEVNIGYAATESEADEYADALLTPDPLPEAEIRVPNQDGIDLLQPLVNYTVDFADQSKDIDETEITIEKQTIEQGRATLSIGEGKAASIESVLQREKSREDKNPPGTVMPEERIGDNSIVESKLEDLSVSIGKIQDEAVAEAKVRQDAISEVKIQDDAISTPKLQAGSIVSGKIDTAAIQAIHIEADAVESGKIDADAVGAREIIASSITADEIDVLNLDAGSLSISDDPTDPSSGVEFEVDSTGDVDFRPLSGTLANIGQDREFNIIAARSTRLSEGVTVGDTSFTPTAGSAWFDPATGDGQVAIAGDGTYTTFRPNTDNSGTVGTSAAAWNTVYAHNFTEQTPDSDITVDLEKLPDYSWREPPEYACRRKTEGGYERRNPQKDGIALGHMTNYLLETCKAQQEVIDEQESRIDELEERLSALEEQV